MGSHSGCSGDNIGAIVGVKALATLQVTHDSGSSDNEILMEKADG